MLALAPPASLKGDARRACEEFHAAGGRAQAFARSAIEGEVIVDAIFGIGITRPASGDYAAAIDAANASGRRILAVDLPSGLDADDGRAHGEVIRADATLSFIGRKLGCYLGSGPDHAGLRLFSDLDVPPRAYENVPAAAQLIGPEAVRAALPPRPRTAHKGRHGHVLVIGGASGMAGAARLAGEAALRAGAGLVSIATHRASAPAIAGRPELMVAAVDAAAELSPLLERASIVAVGPGLGQHDWSRAMLEAALASGLPAVVDADALNLLALAPRRREDWVLTPHPGEAARLLGIDAAARAAGPARRRARVAAPLRRHGRAQGCRYHRPGCDGAAVDLRSRQSGDGGRRHGRRAHGRHRRHRRAMPRPVARGVRGRAACTRKPVIARHAAGSAACWRGT